MEITKKILSIVCIFAAITVNKAQVSDQVQQISSLATMNSISVTLGGNFIVSGSFPASATERVDQFVTRIYNQGKANFLNAARERLNLEYIETIDENYALRGILLKHSDGTEQKIDLLKFRLTGDFELNPYLKNDDVLIFPPVDLETNFFEIAGAVNSPTKVQFVDGDKLSDAIFYARGLNKAYENIECAEITRLSYDGNSEEILKVKLTEDFELQRGDRIRILADETQRREFSVRIRGEVNRPGIIFIKKENSTIFEVIQKAGGFTENADLRRAEIIRGSNVFRSAVFNKRFEEMLMRRMAHIDREDSLQFVIDNTLRFARGNGIVDFTNVLDENSADSKFMVKDGDLINIPEKVDLVYVFGHVGNPGYVEFSAGKDFNYYIEKAGGIGDYPLGEKYLIKGKSRKWIELDDVPVEIDPGDFIWVPKEPYRTYDYYLNRIGNIAQIVGSITTVILLIIQVSK